MPKKQSTLQLVPAEELEYYVDPLDEWIADNHGEWSEKYAGMCVAIVEEGKGTYRVGFVEADRSTAFRRFREEFPDKIPHVSYIPTDDEMEMVL
ncbi:MAG: hypothetical protein HY318_11695 [Armatimonadetes bacterium]|nr:hypothetical protein [Armatimonadota bacterium]